MRVRSLFRGSCLRLTCGLGLFASLLLPGSPATAQSPASPAESRLDSSLDGSTPLRSDTRYALWSPAVPAAPVEPFHAAFGPARATVRYSWAADPNWDLKVGLASNLAVLPGGGAWSDTLAERARLTSAPVMHFSGEGRVGTHWRLSLSAQGMHLPRGNGLDMDLRVDYRLAWGLDFFGGYRFADGDGMEAYGFVPSNATRLGLSWHF
jgi:hypothetical protein